MNSKVFDIEADGLLDTITTIHVIVIDGTPYTNIEEAVRELEKADMIVGHNIIGFDIPAIKKFYPFKVPKVRDTLVLSRLAFPERQRHGLDSWGEDFKHPKIDYQGGFDELSEAMIEYCIRDVELTTLLWERIQLRMDVHSKLSRLEHEVADVVCRQERDGFELDVQGCERMYAELADERQKLEESIDVSPYYVSKGEFIPKRDNTTLGYIEGAPLTRISLNIFNPGSTDQVAYILQRDSEWEPKEFTPTGKPKVDEAVLGELDYPLAKDIGMYMLLTKRLSQLQSWLELERDGRIYGKVNPNGTWTGRATHSNPNVAQVPSNRLLWGRELRSLWTSGEGRVLVDVDLAQLELRILAHYLFPYDNGRYRDILLNSDAHQANADAMKCDRDTAKTAAFAIIYGCGVRKLAETLDVRFGKAKNIRNGFTSGTVGYKRLVKAVTNASERGWVKGLDGRKIPIRNSYSALNFLIQSGGAVTAKAAMVAASKLLRKRNISYKQVAWVHDAYTYECSSADADALGNTVVEAIKGVHKLIDLRVEQDGEYRIGKTWSDCH